MRATAKENGADSQHPKFILKLSKGKKISWKDLKYLKHLSHKDYEDFQWRFAPVLVASNLERHNINRMKARQWAIEHDTYVFKWKNKIQGEENRPSLNEMEKIMDDNAFFLAILDIRCTLLLINKYQW